MTDLSDKMSLLLSPLLSDSVCRGRVYWSSAVVLLWVHTTAPPGASLNGSAAMTNLHNLGPGQSKTVQSVIFQQKLWPKALQHFMILKNSKDTIHNMLPGLCGHRASCFDLVGITPWPLGKPCFPVPTTAFQVTCTCMHISARKCGQ